MLTILKDQSCIVSDEDQLSGHALFVSMTKIPQSSAITRLILEVGLTSTILQPARAEPIKLL